jgi:hypothetical protein
MTKEIKQAQGEPVAWMYICDGDEAHPVLVNTQKDWTRASWWHEVPLYTKPQTKEWVGLSDDERRELWWNTDMSGMPEHDYGKAIESKLKEKNGYD